MNKQNVKPTRVSGHSKDQTLKKKKLNLKGQGFSVCNFGIFPYFAVESFY